MKQRSLFPVYGAIPKVKLSIYLAGPMTNVGVEEAEAWRTTLRRKWSDAYDMKIPSERDEAIEHLEFEEKIIRIRDGERGDILDSTATLAYVDRNSMGTAMGIMYAYLSGRTVVVVDDLSPESDGQKVSLSKMVRAHAHMVFKNENVEDSFDQAMAFIEKRHSRKRLKGAVRPNGRLEDFDPLRVVGAIQSAIDRMLMENPNEGIDPPSAERLAEAVMMQLEDEIETGAIKPDVFSFDIARVVAKVLMDNSHRKEVHTLARTFMVQVNRKLSKREGQLRGQDRLGEIKNFLHDVKPCCGRIKRGVTELKEILGELGLESEVLDDCMDILGSVERDQQKLYKRLIDERWIVEERYRQEDIRLGAFFEKELRHRERDNISIEIQAPEDLYLRNSRQNLCSILENIVSNGIKHGLKGSPGTIFVSARSGVECAEQVLGQDDVIIDIWNDGEDLSATVAKTIFDREGSSKKQDKDSWQWGLSQVRRYVEESGGEIKCQPLRRVVTDDGGVQFEDSGVCERGLPRFRITFENARPEELSKKLILIADDDEHEREAVARKLKRAGFDVVEAGTIGKAIEAIDAEDLFGAVLDFDFKEDKDGVFLLERLMDSDTGVRAVMVSAVGASASGRNWLEEADKLGARGIFNKESYAWKDLMKLFEE